MGKEEGRKGEGRRKKRHERVGKREGEGKRKERDTERKIPKHPGINEVQGLQMRPMCSQG